MTEDAEQVEMTDGATEELSLVIVVLTGVRFAETRATDIDLDRRSCTGAEKLSPKQCLRT